VFGCDHSKIFESGWCFFVCFWFNTKFWLGVGGVLCGNHLFCVLFCWVFLYVKLVCGCWGEKKNLLRVLTVVVTKERKNQICWVGGVEKGWGVKTIWVGGEVGGQKWGGCGVGCFVFYPSIPSFSFFFFFFFPTPFFFLSFFFSGQITESRCEDADASLLIVAAPLPRRRPVSFSLSGARR